MVDIWEDAMPSGSSPATDAAAFEDEVAPHLPWLLRMALRLTRHEQAAEDLLQDTLERGFVHFGRFQPGTNVRAWLFQIMRNVRISAYRSTARRPATTSLDVVDEHVVSEAVRHRAAMPSDVEALVVSRLGEEAILHAIERLPEAYRLAVVLSDVEGDSYREMAVLLDVPLGTVTSRLHRGRKQLQRMLWNEAHRSGPVTDADRVRGAA
jgi:RNA polymerase sigma-70 factor (ECF subfamily)